MSFFPKYEAYVPREGFVSRRKPQIAPVMQEKIYVSESMIGRGVFAKLPLKPRELIFYMNGKLIDFEKSIAHMGEYSVQIGAHSYVDPISPARYLNHSCAPNAGFVDDISLIALRPIAPGEEIQPEQKISWRVSVMPAAEYINPK